MITTAMMRKRWKIRGTTQRVLNVNADAVISFHTAAVVTEDDEVIMTIKTDHLEALDPAIRSQLELALAQHVVELHNESLKPKQQHLTNTQTSSTSPTAPVKKKGGWPKGKPRKPKNATNGQEGKTTPQSGRGTDPRPAQPNQGGQVQEGVQAQPFPPSGEGWFRP